MSIFRSRGNFFSRGTREKKTQGTEIGQREEKPLPKSRKKEAKICTTFRNEVQKTIYLLVVYKRGLQYSLAVFVGFLYSSLAVPGLYYFLEYSRLDGKYSRVTSKRKNINKFEAALLGWRVRSEAGFEKLREIYVLP